jgi:hypothetical protein
LSSLSLGSLPFFHPLVIVSLLFLSLVSSRSPFTLPFFFVFRTISVAVYSCNDSFYAFFSLSNSSVFSLLWNHSSLITLPSLLIMFVSSRFALYLIYPPPSPSFSVHIHSFVPRYSLLRSLFCCADGLFGLVPPPSSFYSYRILSP